MTEIMTRDQLRQVAPSVFASHPIDGVSDAYAFLPTISVIDTMEDMGFVPVKATQTITRLPDNRPFARHMVRLRHISHLNAELFEEVGEIVLSNSHNRTAAYSLGIGLWRQVCSNGLMAMSSDFGSFSIRHKGRDTRKSIEDATSEIVATLPRVFQTVNDWKRIILPRDRQIAFAEQAHALKPNVAIKPAFLLTARRPEDAVNPDFSRDLWRTLNAIQENIMQGGLTGTNSRGRRIRTRPVKAVAAEMAINKSLWQLAGQIAELN